MDAEDAAIALSSIKINIKYALSVAHDHNWSEVKAKTEYALWIIQSGSLTIEYGQDKYFLSEGDVFFFYPQVLYHATSSKQCSFIFVHFDAILGKSCQALHFYPFDGHYPSGKTDTQLASLVASVACLQKREPFSELSVQGSLMFYLSSIMRMRYQEQGESASSSRSSELARLQPVLIYINHHLAEPIRIEALAQIISLSEKYFISFFKKAMGTTPINYITQVKMKKALEYLNEQSYSVKEVASMVGYTDIYTFSKAFKKVYGVSPSKF